MRRNPRRGSAILEFTLAGVPLIFIWISIVQMALGMWRYHTLQYAVQMAGSYIAVHGSNCSTPTNSCEKTIGDAAQVLHNAAPGIPPSLISVTFTAIGADHVTAEPGAVTCRLDECLANGTAWPPAAYADPGYDTRVQATYTLRSILPSPGSVNSGAHRLTAVNQQMIVF